jgi:hypothetical protein
MAKRLPDFWVDARAIPAMVEALRNRLARRWSAPRRRAQDRIATAKSTRNGIERLLLPDLATDRVHRQEPKPLT